jgi:hypothetical protein
MRRFMPHSGTSLGSAAHRLLPLLSVAPTEGGRPDRLPEDQRGGWRAIKCRAAALPRIKDRSGRSSCIAFPRGFHDSRNGGFLPLSGRSSGVE